MRETNPTDKGKMPVKPTNATLCALFAAAAVGGLVAFQALSGAPQSVAFSGDNHIEITDKVDIVKRLDKKSDSYQNLKTALRVSDTKTWNHMSAPHCDNADHLIDADNGNMPYVRTRQEANLDLQACVTYAHDHYRAAIQAAGRLVDAQGAVVKGQADTSSCDFDDTEHGWAKCEAIEAVGRWWHAVEDFYAHSNYADYPDPGLPVDVGNPPGLHMSAPVPLMNMRAYDADPRSLTDLDRFAAVVPSERLTTGCFHEEVGATGSPNDSCERDREPLRVTHQDDAPSSTYRGNGVGLAKDNMGYRRAQASTDNVTNYDRVVTQTVVEINQQWDYFQQALRETYGKPRADAMITAITTDVG